MQTLRNVFLGRLKAAIFNAPLPRPVRRAVAPIAEVSFARLCNKASNLSRFYYDRMDKSRGLLTPAEMFSSAATITLSGSIYERHSIVDKIRADALLFTPRPREFQIDMIEFWLELSAPRIYGEFWQTDYVAIKKRNGWETPNIGIGAIRSGRKDGKSTGLAFCVALALFNFPKAKWALHAVVHEQSRIVLGMASQVARCHPRAGEFTLPRASRNVFRVINRVDDVRIATAYSGNETVRLFFCFCLFFQKREGGEERKFALYIFLSRNTRVFIVVTSVLQPERCTLPSLLLCVPASGDARSPLPCGRQRSAASVGGPSAAQS